MEFFKSLGAIFLLVNGILDSPTVQEMENTTTMKPEPKVAIEHRVWTHPATEELVILDVGSALTGKYLAHADCDLHGDRSVSSCKFYLYEDLRPRRECWLDLNEAGQGRVHEVALTNHVDGRWAVVNWREVGSGSSVTRLAVLDWSSCELKRQRNDRLFRQATILKVLPFKRDAKFAMVLVNDGEQRCRDFYCVATFVGDVDADSAVTSSPPLASPDLTPLYERRANMSYEYLDFVLLEEDKITGSYAHFMLIEDFSERLEDEETPASDRLTERITILKSDAPNRIDGNYSAHVIFDYVHFPKQTHGHRRIAYSAAGTDGVVSMAVQMKARSHPGWIIHCQQYKVDDFRVIYSIDVPYEPRDMAISTTPGNHAMLLTYAECLDDHCRGAENIYHARRGGSDSEDTTFAKRECDTELARAEGRIYRDEREPDRFCLATVCYDEGRLDALEVPFNITVDCLNFALL